MAYNLEINYLVPGFDISREELQELIEEADRVIAAAAEKSARTAEAYLKKSQCLQKLGKYTESKAPIEQALSLFPDMVESVVQLGNIYLAEKSYDEAMAMYNWAIHINPGYAAAFTGRGDLYSEKEEWKKAIVDYTKAIRLRPDNTIALINRLKAYDKTGEYDKAEQIDSKSLEPVSAAKINQNRGIPYIDLTEYEKAITNFNEAARLRPDNVGTNLYYREIAMTIKETMKKPLPTTRKILDRYETAGPALTRKSHTGITSMKNARNGYLIQCLRFGIIGDIKTRMEESMSKLRVVSWNCRWGFSEDKFNAVEKLDADILVVQECSKTDWEGYLKSKYGLSSDWFSDGKDADDSEKKDLGIFVFCKEGPKPERLYTDVKFRYVLPYKIGGKKDLTLFAIWTKGKGNDNQKYKSYLALQYNVWKGQSS
jgi:tetratricopeptide (TPR) repeat protein